MNKIGTIPEFDNEGEEEVKETVEEVTPETEEKETPEESSPEVEPDESEVSDEVDDEEKEKEVAGLERELDKIDKDNSLYDEKIASLRSQIVEKRSERREKKNLIKDVPPDINQESQDDLNDIDRETLDILERFTKAKGLVPITEVEKRLYQSEHEKAEQRFYDKHPEYKPENDADDALYNSLKEELSYFVEPKNPSEIVKLFEKAHRSVKDKFPDKFSTRPSKDTAKEERIKKASLGAGGGGAAPSSKNSKLSAKQISILDKSGWSEADIKELM